MLIHFGKYALHPDIIDYVTLRGDGGYVIHFAPTKDGSDRGELEISGDDAEELRAWLDADKEHETLYKQHSIRNMSRCLARDNGCEHEHDA